MDNFNVKTGVVKNFVIILAFSILIVLSLLTGKQTRIVIDQEIKHEHIGKLTKIDAG